MAEQKKFKAGEFIFTEGDVADFTYTVESGSVELFYRNLGSEVKISTIFPGKIFGDLAVFDTNVLRQNSARAVSDTTVKMISPEEFNRLVEQCPPDLQPYIAFAFERVTATKKRTQITQAVTKEDASRITIAPASDELKSQFKAVEITPESLPFRMGGFPIDGKQNRADQLHLAIACSTNPLLVSRQHCEITLDNDTLILTDLGSRFGTIMNGTNLGRGRGVYSASLKKGNNEIILGTADSKFRVTVKC